MDEFGKPITVATQVLARWKRAPKYYPAEVISINHANNTCHLKYLDGDHDEAVPGSNIRMPRSLMDHFNDLVLTKRKAFDELPDMENPEKFYTLNQVIDHASQDVLISMLHWLNTIPDCAYPLRIEEFNYTYDAQQHIINASTQQKFHWAGQAHYDSLGDVVLGYIQDQLKTKYGLVEVLLPQTNDAEANESGSEADASTPSDQASLLANLSELHRTQRVNIFHSPDLLTAKRIVWLIQGSGPIRPGQWARALCINDSLDYGAMFKYVEAAQQRGYAVVILNPNGGLVEASAKEEYDAYFAARAKHFGERLGMNTTSTAEAEAGVEANSTDADSTSVATSAEAKADTSSTHCLQPSGQYEPPVSYYKDNLLKIPYKTLPDGTQVTDCDELKRVLRDAIGPNITPGKKYFIFDQLKDGKVSATTVDSRFHRHTQAIAPGTVASSLTSKLAIPGHCDRETHTCTVYEELISKSSAQEHVIVAQGAGGYSLMALLHKHHASLLPKLRCVAFTDSVHEVSPETPESVLAFLKTNSVNWVASLSPLDTPERLHKGMRNSGCTHVSAGTNLHEFTTGAAFESVWRFIDSRSSDNPSNTLYEIPEMQPPLVIQKRSTCTQS